jgi:hypothetical protein
MVYYLISQMETMISRKYKQPVSEAGMSVWLCESLSQIVIWQSSLLDVQFIWENNALKIWTPWLNFSVVNLSE